MNCAPNELYEHYRFLVDPGQSLLRIDRFLVDRISGVSRNRVQVAIENNFILVNSRPIRANYRVKPRDEIRVVLPKPPSLRDVLPEDIPIDIVYEDDDLIVLNKPSDMVVHPGYNNWTGTLANALVYYFQNLPNKSGVEGRPGLVHRIDKNTSGLMIVAKTESSMTHLAKQFYDHSIDRTYLALVWGSLKEPTGTIDARLTKSHLDRRVVAIVEGDSDIGKRAITHYSVLKDYNIVSLVECRLETGRTHQIRAHMQHLGHPIFGDTKYGGDKILKGHHLPKYIGFIENCFALMPHQTLHAKSLGFVHPRNGDRLFFDSDLPKNFKEILDRWENYFKNYIPQ